MSEMTHKRLQTGLPTHQAMSHRTVFITVLVGMLVLGFGAGQWIQPADGIPDLPGVHVYQPAQPLTAFQLQDHEGGELTPEVMKGRWWFVFFGYTHCPDVCPSTLIQLAEVDSAIERTKAASSLRKYLFISVDPARDDGPQLASYISSFGQPFVGATGDPSRISGLEDQLDAYHRLGTKDASGHYEVQHSSYAYLIDPEGRLTARFEPPFDPINAAMVFSSLQTRPAGGQG